MTKSDAIAYFQGNVSALARAAGVHQSTVYDWGEYPPDSRQLRLQRATKGRLKAEPGCRERVLGLGEAPKAKA
jgi:transposase-like protein